MSPYRVPGERLEGPPPRVPLLCRAWIHFWTVDVVPLEGYARIHHARVRMVARCMRCPKHFHLCDVEIDLRY